MEGAREGGAAPGDILSTPSHPTLAALAMPRALILCHNVILARSEEG